MLTLIGYMLMPHGCAALALANGVPPWCAACVAGWIADGNITKITVEIKRSFRQPAPSTSTAAAEDELLEKWTFNLDVDRGVDPKAPATPADKAAVFNAVKRITDNNPLQSQNLNFRFGVILFQPGPTTARFKVRDAAMGGTATGG